MRILFIVSFLFYQNVSGQDLPKNIDGKIEFADIVSIDSSSAKDLLYRSKMFITKAFNSGKDATQVIDENANSIIAKGWMQVRIPPGFWPAFYIQVWFTVNLQCKDSRYKYSFTDFKSVYQSGKITTTYTSNLEQEKVPEFTKKQWEKVKDQTGIEIRSLIEILKKQMADKSNSNW